MTPYEIKKRLKAAEITMTDIARGLGVSVTSVHLVINRKSVSRRVAGAVAEALEMPMDEIWDKYEKSEN